MCSAMTVLTIFAQSAVVLPVMHLGLTRAEAGRSRCLNYCLRAAAPNNLQFALFEMERRAAKTAKKSPYGKVGR